MLICNFFDIPRLIKWTWKWRVKDCFMWKIHLNNLALNPFIGSIMKSCAKMKGIAAAKVYCVMSNGSDERAEMISSGNKLYFWKDKFILKLSNWHVILEFFTTAWADVVVHNWGMDFRWHKGDVSALMWLKWSIGSHLQTLNDPFS